MIAEHDLKIRINQAKNFLRKGTQVKVTVLFWGKFKRKDKNKNDKFMKLANEKLERFTRLGKLVSPAKMRGSKYTLIIEPK
jgi:translation initiation factor IF-3